MTQAEFADCMTKIKEQAVKKVRANFSTSEATDLIKRMTFSFDNAACHKCPNLLLTKAGISAEQRLPIPPHCCDVQQPIEHALGRFKTQLLKLLRRRKGSSQGWWPEDVTQIKSTCTEIWEQVTTEAVVSPNVMRLLKLYDYIAKRSKGGWAAKRLF